MAGFLLNYKTAFAANSTSPGERFNYLFFSKRIALKAWTKPFRAIFLHLGSTS